MYNEENARKADHTGVADAGGPAQQPHVRALHPQCQCNHQAGESAILHAGLHGSSFQVVIKHAVEEPPAVERLFQLPGHQHSLTVNATAAAFFNVPTTVVAQHL